MDVWTPSLRIADFITKTLDGLTPGSNAVSRQRSAISRQAVPKKREEAVFERFHFLHSPLFAVTGGENASEHSENEGKNSPPSAFIGHNQDGRFMNQCPPWIRTGRHLTQTNFSAPSVTHFRQTLSLSVAPQTKHFADMLFSSLFRRAG